ncbi:MAG: hypothetical protein WCC77_23810, partial [Pseudolabrys sp.]
MTRALIIAAILFVPTSVCALDIGARLPIKYGEIFMVRNDDGIRNWSSYFPYGANCPVKWRLPMWLVVTRVVADRVLLMVDLNNLVAELSCPHGTETSMPYAQARKRYEDYVR